MKNKIAIFLADGFETCEALVVFDFLKRAKTNVELINANIENKREVVSAQGVVVTSLISLEQVVVSDYGGVVIPGGQPGTNNLLVNPYFRKVITKFINSTDGFIAAICAAPFLLDKWGFLKNKNITVFPTFREKITSAKVISKSVVVDGRFITAKAIGSSFEFSVEILKKVLRKNHKLLREVISSAYFSSVKLEE